MRVALWWGQTKPSALSVVPAWAVQQCTPSRGGWQAFAAFDAWVSPPSLLVAIVLPWVCFILRFTLMTSFAILDVFVSPIPGQSFTRDEDASSPLSAGPSQCRSVLHPSQIGWQICSARCPDPTLLVQLLVTLVQPLDFHARLHVSYMCSVLYVLLLLAHMLVAPHWRWGRFICTQCGARALLFRTALPIHPGSWLQCSISRPRLLSSHTGRCYTPLHTRLLPLQCRAFTWQ